jgi:hypothetical protein
MLVTTSQARIQSHTNHNHRKPMSASFNDVPKYARSSKRVTITVPFHVFNYMFGRSAEEGRSISNLMAYLLERAIDAGKF